MRAQSKCGNRPAAGKHATISFLAGGLHLDSGCRSYEPSIQEYNAMMLGVNMRWFKNIVVACLLADCSV